jgi:hypothetical protein
LLEKITGEQTASGWLSGSPKLYRKLRPRTTISRRSLPVADKVLGRNFSVARPDLVWTSAVTESFFGNLKREMV